MYEMYMHITRSILVRESGVCVIPSRPVIKYVDIMRLNDKFLYKL